MKKILCVIILAFVVLPGISQIKAVTSNGDEVILNPDGTWYYLNEDSVEETKIDTSSLTFSRAATATFIVKSKRTDFGTYINPKKWTFERGDDGEAAEFQFKLKEKDAYGMMITEKIEIPLTSLKNIAVLNARSAAPDIRVTKEEYRRVNDKIVLLLQMEGTIQSIKFIYYGYYFSSASGTVQFLTYTAANLFAEYKPELEELLNGFVVQE